MGLIFRYLIFFFTKLEKNLFSELAVMKMLMPWKNSGLGFSDLNYVKLFGLVYCVKSLILLPCKIKGTPPSKTKILTTYQIITKLNTKEDSINAIFSSKFQAYISIMTTVSEELATLRKRKKGFIKNPTLPTVFAAHSSNFAQSLTTKLQRASRSRIFDFSPR